MQQPGSGDVLLQHAGDRDRFAAIADPTGEHHELITAQA